jgi:argininosuccinate synthase
MTNDNAMAVAASPLFSKRLRMGEAAVEWCKERGASPTSPLNIVTALLSMGLVVALTDEEREAIEMAADDNRYHQDPGGRAAHIERTLRGLLERTKFTTEGE